MTDLEKFEDFFGRMGVPFNRDRWADGRELILIDCDYLLIFAPAGELIGGHNGEGSCWDRIPAKPDCGCIPDKIICAEHAKDIRKAIFSEVKPCAYCSKLDCACSEMS